MCWVRLKPEPARQTLLIRVEVHWQTAVILWLSCGIAAARIVLWAKKLAVQLILRTYRIALFLQLIYQSPHHCGLYCHFLKKPKEIYGNTFLLCWSWDSNHNTIVIEVVRISAIRVGAKLLYLASQRLNVFGRNI